MNYNLGKALMNVGELCGMASRLDIKELETYLESNPKHFAFAAHCRAAITFARVMQSGPVASHPAPPDKPIAGQQGQEPPKGE